MDNTPYLFLSCLKALDTCSVRVLSPHLSQAGEERGLHSQLSLQDPKCVSVLGHSNGNGWSSLMSLVKCTCVASPTCKGKSGQLGRLVSTGMLGISKGNFSKRTLDTRDFSMERIWLEREAGKGEARLSDACVTASLGDTGPLTGTSLSLIYCRLNEKCFDILGLLLCHIGNMRVKGLPGFLWQAPYLWYLIFLPV